jgi:aminoglycoside 2'-N-acetyltransferase I
MAEDPLIVRHVLTASLTLPERSRIRSLLDAAFGTDEDERFTDEDWAHALGGTHFILVRDRRIVTHASVVERTLEVGTRRMRTGYVEAVATDGSMEGRGYGSRVMADVRAFILERFELGALGTGRQRFYGRLGWETWRGPSSVRAPDGHHLTPDDDGYIMVLRTPRSANIDPTAPISCDWRSGDVW